MAESERTHAFGILLRGCLDIWRFGSFASRVVKRARHRPKSRQSLTAFLRSGEPV
jgi:hypothetical protein